MSASQIVLLVVAVFVVAAVIGVVLSAARRKRRSEALQGAFGPEYARTVDAEGGRSAGERELAARQATHAQLDIRPLTPASRQRYAQSWSTVQARFVDDPVLAFTESDHLLTQLMRERGYPTEDVEQQAGLLSVEHGRVLEHYRAGHAIEQVTTSTSSDTEQVRQGMLHFRTVFEELLEDRSAPYPENAAGDRTDAER